MTRSLVVGGAGFVGRHLAADLVDRGHTVTVADLDVATDRLPGVRYVACDVRKPLPLDLCAEPPDEVYNLAAVHRVPGHEDHEYFDTNVPGAEHVTAYCAEVGVRRLVFTSSISVYGPSEAPKDETSTPAPTTAYGASKLEAEGIHRAWAEEDADRRLVMVRPAVIFGPGERGNFTRLAKALRRRTFVYPGRRDTVKGCCHVDDLVASTAFAFGLDRPQFLYNLAYRDPLTIEDICEAFHDVAGLPRPVATVPLAPMLGVGRVFERLADAGLETGIGRPRIMKLVRSTNIVPAALTEAGYVYQTDLRQGLRRWHAAFPRGQFV